MSSGRQVTIIVTDEFAPRLDDLASSGHVWVVRTAATEEAARRIWEEHPPQETDPLASGVTLFKGGEGSEDDLLWILDEVGLHHGSSGGHFPPMSAIRVLGPGPTHVVREALSSLGFTRLVSAPGGFVAYREPLLEPGTSVRGTRRAVPRRFG